MRTAFLTALLLLAAALPAAAQDKAKPNTLTPKEIADGWILLFDGETTFGWKTQGPQAIDDGQWTLDGGSGIETFAHYGEGVIAFEYRQTGKERKADVQVQGNPVGLLAVSDKTKWLDGYFVIKDNKLTRVLRGKSIGDKDAKYPVATKPLSAGSIGFSVPIGSQLPLRNIKFLPGSTTSLFNGKDLTGWKAFPNKTSVFTVEDGCITCKNGPGDLQTEGKYANFVLQLECKSNGKHLNSGIFFRCKANEYQNGYEAQIHNNFTADPPKEYTVEEYDPETHKLTGKKKVTSAATDYGTGAIYRRVPARKDVAKDGEWFTMTIVAHGNHISTWVNGIHVTDFVDNRTARE